MSSKHYLPRKVSIAILIIAIYVVTAALSQTILKESDVKNWNNLDYWDKNPKAKPPEWYGKYKGLPPSEWLNGEYKNGKYTFTYHFHYTTAPDDIVVFMETNKPLKVTITTPSNESITLFRGSPSLMNYKIHLKKNYPLFEELAKERCGMKIRGQSFFGKNVFNTIFSAPTEDCLTSPKPLYGDYKIVIQVDDSPITRVIYGGRSPKIEPNESIKVFIAGQTFGLLGTDTFGRDVWVGFIGGMKETLIVAFSGAVISVGLGLLLGTVGAISGIKGTSTNMISRFLTVLPSLPFAIVTIMTFGTIELEKRIYIIRINPLLMAFIMGLLLTGNVSRNIRSIVKEELKKGYAESSQALGGDLLWILRKHVSKVLVPYSLGQLAVGIPGVIAMLTLLGFFNVVSGFNWSSLMSQTIVYNAQYQFLWWQVLPVGVSMGVLAISFVIVSSWIEDEFTNR